MKKESALIGYSGFIGSHLLNFSKKLVKYNSKNINKIKNTNYNTVICAGTYSKIWLANKNQKEDFDNTNKLIENLKTIKANRFILISTSEVYGNYYYNNNQNCNEAKLISGSKLSSYGYNRLRLEKFIKKKFINHNIIRLPIVYGERFSKNFIFDLINKKNLSKINGNDYIQIYHVKNLTQNIKHIIKKKIKTINLSSSPVKISEIAKEFFNLKTKQFENSRIINMKSIHAKNDQYYLSKKKCLTDLKSFLKNFK